MKLVTNARKTLPLLLVFALLGSPALAQSASHTVVGLYEGADSARRVVYMDGGAYTLAATAKAVSEDGNTQLDPLLLKTGQPVAITLKEINGIKTITKITVLKTFPQ